MPKAAFWVLIAGLVVVVLAVQRPPDPVPAADRSGDTLMVHVGDRALTVAGTPACARPEALDQILNLLAQADTVAARRVAADRSSGCLVLRGGDTVIKSGASMFRIRIRVPGEPQELHTVSGAIRRLR